MALIQPVTVDGLTAFTGNLRALDADLPKALRLAGIQGATMVVGWAQPRVARRSGRAAGSVRVEPNQTGAGVSAGGPRVAYFGWLDFGGRVGRRKSVTRPFIAQGRYIWPGFMHSRESIADRLTESLLVVARQAGIEVHP